MSLLSSLLPAKNGDKLCCLQKSVSTYVEDMLMNIVFELPKNTVRNTELNYGKIQWAFLVWLLHFRSVLAFSCVVLSGVMTWSSLRSDQPIWRIEPLSHYHMCFCFSCTCLWLLPHTAMESLGPPLHSAFDIIFQDILSQDVHWYLVEWVDIMLELYFPQKACRKSCTC